MGGVKGYSDNDRGEATWGFVPFAYGLISFSWSCMHNIWATYSLQYFAIGRGVSDFPLMVANALFMIWNAMNDPIVGWLCHRRSSVPLFGVRDKMAAAVLYGGVSWGVLFAVMWLPWSSYGGFGAAFHFFVAACT